MTASSTFIRKIVTPVPIMFVMFLLYLSSMSIREVVAPVPILFVMFLLYLLLRF